MVGKPNSEKLTAALATLLREWGEGGERPTVSEVCRRSGVSRATANRDQSFLERFRTETAKAPPVVPTDAEELGARRKVRVADLRRTIDDMANIIQKLHLAYEVQERELNALRLAASSGKVVPLSRLGASRGRRIGSGPAAT